MNHDLNDLDLFAPHENTDFVDAVLAQPADEILAELKASGLRGRGGAGFPVAAKWEAALRAPGHPKYVICNADEGEPGTFKDREILLKVPEKVWLGMTLCSRVLGARTGFVYLRWEYRFMKARLQAGLDRFHERLGRAGVDFRIEIFSGAGAYVCGEETALLESMEGRRGEPRNKPPFPTVHGYLEQPTVINNVESFAYAAEIARLGAAYFRETGVAKGLSRLFCVAGDTRKPGIHTLAAAMPVSALVAEFGDGDTKAVQIGGASGFCVPNKEFNTAVIGQNGLPAGGSILLFNHQRSMFRVLENFLEFFGDESCGQCTPCRVGSRQLLEGLRAVKAKHKPPAYLDRLLALTRTIQDGSKCGLGRMTGNSFRSIVNNFREEMIY